MHRSERAQKGEKMSFFTLKSIFAKVGLRTSMQEKTTNKQQHKPFIGLILPTYDSQGGG